jgi:hypothetical protein
MVRSCCIAMLLHFFSGLTRYTHYYVVHCLTHSRTHSLVHCLLDTAPHRAEMSESLRDTNETDSTHVPFPRTMTGTGTMGLDDGSRRSKSSAGDDDNDAAFPRTMTGQFLRTLTTTGLVDEDWGKDAIEEIENVANKGHEGDTPEQPPFAKNKLFWMLAVNALAMGMALGLASIVFINIIDEVPKVWSDVDTHGGYDFEEEENVGFNDGKVRRIGCLAAWLNGCRGCQVVD